MERYFSSEGKIAIILFFFSILMFPRTGKCNIYHVKKHSSLNSIQNALNRANDYDTILIFSGEYFEKNLVINKPLFVQGINNPVLDGEMKYEILSIWSSHVTVKGLTLRNCGTSGMNDIAGIKVYNASNVTISNNVLLNMFFGIYFQGCTNSIATGNRLEAQGNDELQSGNGIHCWKCDSMIIQNNDVSGHRDGIYFEFVTNSTIKKNNSHKNVRYGLHFMFSHHNIYIKNIFQSNGAGVAVMYTHHVTMVDNIFRDNWGSAAYGLLLKEISDSQVKNNKFINNSSGIYMEGCSRIHISNNHLLSNGCALRIQASCDDNVIEKNNFWSNSFDVTTNGSLILNKFNNNYWDKYEGYDLNRDNIGDIPYHPVSVYSMIIERMPVAILFIRSFMVTLLEKTEKAIPGITPENFKDSTPCMKPVI